MSESTPAWRRPVVIVVGVLVIVLALVLVSPVAGSAFRSQYDSSRIVSHEVVGQASATLSCPSDWTLTGGGAEVDDKDVYIQSSAPKDDDAWAVTVQNRNPDSGPGSWTIYAVCAK